jgi:hypothetical protein
VAAVEQDEREARVTVVDPADGRAVVAADYVLGCDGPRSALRAAIGAAYEGLQSPVRHGPAVQYWTVNPAAPALMGPIDLEGTWWIIAFGVEAERGARDAAALIDAAAGAPVAAEVLSHDPWTARMQLVDRARELRARPRRRADRRPALGGREAPGLAPEVRVPVHNVLAEHDALWDSSPESVERFASLLAVAPFVDASIMRGVGHSLDHHRSAYALHLRQLAFAHDCATR